MEHIYKTIAAAIMEKAKETSYFALRIEEEGWSFRTTAVVQRAGNVIIGIMPLWWECDIDGFSIDTLIDYLKNYDRHDTCDNQNNPVQPRGAE